MNNLAQWLRDQCIYTKMRRRSMKKHLERDRCWHCKTAIEVETLLTESGAKDAALDRAIVAIKTLPEDALGYGKSQDIAEQSWNRWPFRDELLAELEAAVQVGQRP